MLDCILNKVNDGIAFEAGETTKAEVAWIENFNLNHHFEIH